MIGRNIEVGIGKETSRGTSVAPLYWLPNYEAGIEDKKEYVDNVQSFGNIHDSDDSQILKEWAEGEITGKVRDRSIGLILAGVFGAAPVSTAMAGGNSAVYEHAYSVANNNQHQSLTIVRKDSFENLRFANGVVESFKLTGEIGKFLEYALATKSKKGVSGSSDTVSYLTSEVDFNSRHLSMKLASALAGLDAASVVAIRSFEISIEKNTEEIMALGSASPSDFVNKEFVVEINIEAEYTALDTFKTQFLAGTKKALRITAANTDTTIGADQNPTIQFDFAKVALQSWERDGGAGDIIRQSIRGKAHYSLADAKALTCLLRNLVTSY